MKKGLLNLRGLFTVFLFAMGVFLLTVNPNDNRADIPHRLLREIKPYPESLIDSMTPYKTYKSIYDSLKRIEEDRKWRLSDVGGGEGSNFFGIRNIVECDSCNKFYNHPAADKKEFETKYFFTLDNFILKPDATFFIEKGKYMIRNIVWSDGAGNIQSGRPETKEIKVRFVSGFKPFQKNKTALWVPISKNAYNFWKYFHWFIFIPLLVILSWISFILPIKVLYRVAMGSCFVEKNVSNLRLAGWALISSTILPIAIASVTKLFMGSVIPEEIYFPCWLYLIDNKGWLIGGICLLIISNAFKQGIKLKEEQELTV